MSHVTTQQARGRAETVTSQTCDYPAGTSRAETVTSQTCDYTAGR